MHSKQQLIRLRWPSWFFASLLCSPLLAADVEKVLYSFTRSDGSIPYPALILDAKGNLGREQGRRYLLRNLGVLADRVRH